MDKHKIITKYALLLIIFYTIQFGVDHLIQLLPAYDEYDKFETIKKYLIFIGLTLVLNLITALIVSRDIKKYKLKIKYLILCTILFRILGVSLFLIGIMNQENEKMRAPNTVSK